MSVLVVSVCRECTGCRCVGSVRGVGLYGVYEVLVCMECTGCPCVVSMWGDSVGSVSGVSV